MSVDLKIELSVMLIGLVTLALGVWMRKRPSVNFRTLGAVVAILGALASLGGALRAAPFVLSLLSADSRQAEIPPMSARQLELIRAVMQGEAVTRELHAEFWKPLRDAGLSNDQLLNIQDEFTKGESILIAQRYAREGWRCARLSFEASRVVRTDLLKGLQQSMLRSVRQSVEGTREVETAFAHSRLLLDAAAKRGVLSIPGREQVPITIELIDSVESSIDDTFARLQRLLSPAFLEQR